MFVVANMSDDGSEEFPEEGTNLGTYEGDRNEADERSVSLYHNQLTVKIIHNHFPGLISTNYLLINLINPQTRTR